MSTKPLESLADQWRDEAKTLRRRGADAQATALESAAEDLEQAWERWWREPLSPEEAANESGYTTDHIRRLLREGRLPNAGDDSLKVRRRSLPVKAGHRRGAGERSGFPSPSRTRVARAVVDSD